MNAQLQKTMHAFDQREPRERIILLVAFILCLFSAWDQLYYSPMEEKLSVLESQQENLKAQSDAAVKTLAKTLDQSNSPQDDVRQLELSALHNNIRRLEQQIGALNNLAIPPELIPSVLERMLSSNKGLELVSLTNVAPKRVPEVGPDQPAPKVALYKHGMQVSLQGDYLSTAQYLLDIENLPWSMQFERLRFETLEYPKAKIELDIGTVSLSEDWIGV